jgi:hypothetical protein
MKILFTICLSLCSLLYVQGQSIDKQVIASAGNTQGNASNKIISTIGEPIIGLKGSGATINQGFLAGVSSATLSVEELIKDVDVKVYPNPFTDHIIFSLGEIQGKVSAVVYNSAGQQVAQQSISSSQSSIQLDQLVRGLYLVQLHFTTTNTFKSFKIIKK